MTQEDFDWWLDLIERYQKADDRYYELCCGLKPDDWSELQEIVQEHCNCDLEDYPEALNNACDEWEEDD